MTLLSCFGCLFTEKVHFQSLKWPFLKTGTRVEHILNVCLNVLFFKKQKKIAIPAGGSFVNTKQLGNNMDRFIT